MITADGSMIYRGIERSKGSRQCLHYSEFKRTASKGHDLCWLLTWVTGKVKWSTPSLDQISAAHVSAKHIGNSKHLRIRDLLIFLVLKQAWHMWNRRPGWWIRDQSLPLSLQVKSQNTLWANTCLMADWQTQQIFFWSTHWRMWVSLAARGPEEGYAISLHTAWAPWRKQLSYPQLYCMVYT
mgnify:CR=1 FL=1